MGLRALQCEEPHALDMISFLIYNGMMFGTTDSVVFRLMIP